MQRPVVAGIVLAAAVAVGAGVSWRHVPPGAPAPTAVVAHAATYQCPMHPQVVGHEPGRCPVCGMTLARVDAAESAVPTGAGAAAPDAVRGAPDAADAVAHGGVTEPESGPSHASFTLSPERAQLIGVRTAPVEYRDVHRDVRTAGRVAFDPDLYAALAEQRAAAEAQAGLGPDATSEARLRVEGLRRSAARRLELLGISSSELAAVGRVEGGATSLLLPGQSAWIYATVHGAAVDASSGATVVAAPDLPRVGQPVVATTRARPGRVFRGSLVTVEPVGGTTAVGSAARQDLRVRALVATPGGGLVAGSFVALTVQIPLGRRLVVPEDAVLDTGTRQLVFVRHPDGRFEPRDVVVGVEGEGVREVLAGVSPGEQVVAAATFLIDSESRFRAAQESLAGATSAPHDGDDAAAR